MNNEENINDIQRLAGLETSVGEEQTFSGRSDRTYFIVPNEDDYMDIQDDSRFAGDIEVPNENADIMALPNSKFRKLKMMYGNKILDLGTDYDEAVEREEQKAKRRHLANISRTKAGGSAGRRSEGMQAEEQTFSGRNDRTYFVVPNEDDYMDIQDDSRFAGDIEVPDENADIMALPNSKARKLKMMYGDKVEFLGTDYDEAVAQMGQEEGYDDEMNDIARLAGIERNTTEAGGKVNGAKKADAAHSELDAEMNNFHPQVEKMLDSKYKKFHNGDPAKRAKVGQKLQAQYDKVMASRQKSQVQQAKPKPMPASTDTYKGSGIKTKPIMYSKQSGPKTPVVKAGGSATGHTKNWMKRHKK